MSKSDRPAGRTTIPLNSIRVFVEVARAQSFRRAAAGLAMTQSGVSHHVGALERYFGRRLFVRHGASVELTDLGRLYYESVREAVTAIELSTRQLVSAVDDGHLVVRTSLPSVAMTVLIPALPRFRTSPPVTVDLLTSLSPPAGADVFDVLLTRDLALPDETHWLLAREELVCVAAPALQARIAGLELAEWPFVVARSRPDVLAEWAAAQPLAASAIRAGASFEHYFLALSAAIGGMGCLVAPLILVAENLRQGHLVEVGGARVRGSSSYSAWVNPRSPRPEVARAFCRWLVGLFRDQTAC